MTDLHEPPPSDCGEARGLARLAREIGNHLWPWRRDGLREAMPLQIASILLGIVVTAIWVLAANGQVRGEILIAWWLAWSAMEVGVRLRTRPYIKEGPWWGRNYRRAGLMDMICYVSFKNLLIGAAFFIGLKSLGVLDA